MAIQFHCDDIVTHVPTCCLIEDYWMLQEALDALNKCDSKHATEAIQCAAECLQESIDRYTRIAPGLKVVPSINSAIAMSEDSGIILNDNEDLKCIVGLPLSSSGYPECNSCSYRKKGFCNPENGLFLLEHGLEYDALDRSCENSFVDDLRDIYDSED